MRAIMTMVRKGVVVCPLQHSARHGSKCAICRPRVCTPMNNFKCGGYGVVFQNFCSVQKHLRRGVSNNLPFVKLHKIPRDSCSPMKNGN